MLNVEISDETSLLMIGRMTDIDTSGGVYRNRATKTTADGPVFCQSGDTDCGAGIRYDANVDLEEFQVFLMGIKARSLQAAFSTLVTVSSMMVLAQCTTVRLILMAVLTVNRVV